MSQPIYQLVHGLSDGNGRLMTDQEASTLTDWFGTYLRKTPYNERPYNLRDLLTKALPARTWRPFAICDGISIPFDSTDTKTVANGPTKLNQIPRFLRFVITCVPTQPDPSGPVKSKIGDFVPKGGLCIVGGTRPDDNDEFLQLASWDPNAQKGGLGYMRFYQRAVASESASDKPEWVYAGSSWNAFDRDTTGQGPFDGHIGGALIMKELKAPWFHWVSQSTAAHQLVLSLGEGAAISKDPLFSTNLPFDNLGGAEELQILVQRIIPNWYKTRSAVNFTNLDTNLPLPKITHIRSWLAHILQSRSMNMACSQTDTTTVFSTSSPISHIPKTFFVNVDGFTPLLNIDYGGSEDFNMSFEAYNNTFLRLQTCLVAGWDRQQRPIVVYRDREGPFPFPIIETGVEDYSAVNELVRLANLTSNPIVILPLKALTCLLMVDFWNPIYSLLREKLFTYVPDEATFLPEKGRYDVLETMLKGINAAVEKDPTNTQAEAMLLDLLATDDATYAAVFAERVSSYMKTVQSKLMSSEAAAEEYMILAESRRRVYRDREDEKEDGAGLNEFALTLPFSLNDTLFKDIYYSVTESGDVIPADKPTAKFLKKIAMSKSVKSTKRFARASLGCPASYSRAFSTLLDVENHPEVIVASPAQHD